MLIVLDHQQLLKKKKLCMLFAHCMYTVIKKLLVCKKTIVKIIPYKNNVQKDTDFCDKNVCGKF